MRRVALSLSLLLAAVPAPSPASTFPLDLQQIMEDPAWIGPAVETPYWTTDGQHIVYALKQDASPQRNLFQVAPTGGAPSAVDDAALADLDAAQVVWDAARQRALMIKDGDLFLRTLGSPGLRQLTRSEAEEAQPGFMTDGRVMFRVGNDWFSLALDSGLISPAARLRASVDPKAAKPDELAALQLRLIGTLAREKSWRDAATERDAALAKHSPHALPAEVFLGDVKLVSTVLSPDGRWLLAVTEDPKADSGRVGKMPTYVTESGYEDSEEVRVRVGRNAPTAQQLWRVDLQDGRVDALDFAALPGIDVDPLADLRKHADKPALQGPRALRVNAIEFTRDGARAAVMLRAVDNKDRWIVEVQAENALQLRHRLTDPAWINWGFNEFGWLPDNRTLWYLSEEDGHAHFYTREGQRKPKQHTRGAFEVSAPQISADGRQVWLLGNRAWPGDYEVYRLDLGNDQLSEVTALDGVESFQLSPDQSQLLVSWSSSYLPTQIAVLPASGGETKPLTDTRSAAFKAVDWLPPQYVQVPSKHGAGTIWGKFYRPATLEPGKRYPIVMFVHGAGYLQNVSARYPAYFREQMFHNLLVSQGYLVLDLDYRASEGYGRDWRTAIYRQMGHPELEDYLDGIDWLVEQQQGDRSRVGIYGGSYGGFMSFMAMFRAPEAFKAGAALRPVTDWTSYNHEYTANILNTPDIDPEAYRLSSPIEYAEGLQGHLLIAHGMIDNNVMYQDSVRLAQRLIELRKDHWELASYPLERHGFVHPEAWFDEYRRIYQLFERTLK